MPFIYTFKVPPSQRADEHHLDPLVNSIDLQFTQRSLFAELQIEQLNALTPGYGFVNARFIDYGERKSFQTNIIDRPEDILGSRLDLSPSKSNTTDVSSLFAILNHLSR